jgi:hypothetical protein
VQATVIGDRGGLGVGGRRLLRIRVPVTADESISFEMPEEELTAEEKTLPARPA